MSEGLHRDTGGTQGGRRGGGTHGGRRGDAGGTQGGRRGGGGRRTGDAGGTLRAASPPPGCHPGPHQSHVTSLRLVPGR